MKRNALLLIAGSFTLEILAVLVMISFSTFLGLVLHALIIGGLCYLNADRSRLMMVYIFSTTFLGPLGAIGGMLLMLYHSISTSEGKSFIEWFNSIFPKHESTLAETIDEALEYGRDLSAEQYSVLPMKDIIALGSLQQQQRALLSISNHFHPTLIPALQMALKSKSGMIRVLASTIITRISNRLHLAIMELEQEAKNGKREGSLLKRLGNYHDLYAFSGLLDEEKERAHRERSLACYLEYLKLHPKDIEVHQNIARIYSRQGRDRETLEWIERCRSQGITSPTMLMWHAETLFRLGRFSDLRALAKRNRAEFSDADLYPPAFNEAVRLWGAHA